METQKLTITTTQDQTFTLDNGSWILKGSVGVDLNITKCLKKGHVIVFTGMFSVVTLCTLNTADFRVKTIYRPNNSVSIYEGEGEVKDFIEKMILENRTCEIIHVI